MFSISRPSDIVVERFVRDSTDLPLSYAPLGLAQSTADGFDVDEAVTVLGHGEDCFERARRGLLAWKQFDLGWTELLPRGAPVDVGTTVAVRIRHLGFWSLNGSRVVYGVGHPKDGPVFGYAYGTLTNHAECGEELFDVSLEPASGEVRYRIRAASKPRAPLARLGYPIVRVLQARFRRDSVLAMHRAVKQ
jgi:uncharacterized protein (UPF0548 family)